MQLVDHCLDSGGLAGTRVTCEQNVGGGLALEKGHGVVQDDLLLPLVVNQGGQPGLVGVDDGDNALIFANVEHDVLGVNSVAVAVDIGAALMIAVHNIQLFCGENRKITIPVKPFPQALRGQVSDGLQNLQFLLHLGFHLRPGLCPAPDHADVSVLVVVDDVLDIARQRPLFGAIEGGHKGGVFGDGFGGSFFPAVQVVQQGRHHGVTEQRPENCQRIQANVQFVQLHTFRIAPFAPLETSAA